MKTYATALLIMVFSVFLASQNNLPIPFRDGKKWGFCDEEGNMVLPAIYDTVSFFSRHPVFEAPFTYGETSVEPIFQKPLAMVSMDSLYGLIDQNGEMLIPIEYLRPFQFNKITDSLVAVYGVSKRNIGTSGSNYQALMDINGNMLTGFDFSASFQDMSGYYKGRCTGGDGAIRLGFYQYFKSFQHYEYVTELPGVKGKVLRVSTNKEGKYAFQGFLDEKGQTVLPATYNWVTLFHNGIAIAANLQPEAGVYKRDYFTIDATGKPLKKLDFALIHFDMVEGLAKVSSDSGKHYGLIDLKGKEVLPQIYDDIIGVRDGLVACRKEFNYAILDTKGNFILDVSGFIPANTGFFAKSKKGKWALYDQHGHREKKIRVDSLLNGLCHNVRCGLNYVEFQKKGKWGLLDGEGRMVLEPTYDLPFEYPLLACPGDPHYQRFYVQKKNDKYGLLDKNFKEMLPFVFDKLRYEEISSYSYHEYLDNYHGFRRNKAETSKWFYVMGDKLMGVVDSSGRVAVPAIYDQVIMAFPEYSPPSPLGYFVVKKDGKWGTLDRGGNVVLPVTFGSREELNLDTENASAYRREHHDSFYEEKGVIRQRGVDMLGKYQGLHFYESCRIADSLFIVEKLYKEGVAKPDGQMVIPMQYSHIKFFRKQKLLKVALGENEEYCYGLYDMSGKEILPCKYDEIMPTYLPGLFEVTDKGFKGFVSSKGIKYYRN